MSRRRATPVSLADLEHALALAEQRAIVAGTVVDDDGISVVMQLRDAVGRLRRGATRAIAASIDEVLDGKGSK